jgi:transcriptional regulator with XRE-family HTH domain
MPRKKEPSTEFGRRLVQLRQARGLTQVQLAQAAGTSQRVISHYETVAEYPAVEVLIAIAKVLRVTTDELLGLKPPARVLVTKPPPEDAALLRRLRLVSQLPERDRRAVLRLIDTAALAYEARRTG